MYVTLVDDKTKQEYCFALCDVQDNLTGSVKWKAVKACFDARTVEVIGMGIPQVMTSNNPRIDGQTIQRFKAGERLRVRVEKIRTPEHL